MVFAYVKKSLFYRQSVFIFFILPPLYIPYVFLSQIGFRRVGLIYDWKTHARKLWNLCRFF